MANADFTLAFTFSNKWEGFISDDSVDPGGFTYRGISRVRWPDWKGWVLVDQKRYREADLLVPDFYKENFWDACGCKDLPQGLAIAVFDTAVNCGVTRSRKWLKKVGGVAARSVELFLQLRLAHYTNLIQKNSSFEKYRKGWNNRVTDLKRYIHEVSY